MNIVQKCIAWNAARYDQELDLDLAIRLLEEETKELHDAGKDLIQVLDACGDIVFVAIGIFWKAKMDDYVIEQILGYEHADELIESVDIHEALKTMDEKLLYTAYPLALASVSEFSDEWEYFAAMNAALLAIYGIVIPRLMAMGMLAELYNIVDAICNSNNTKVIKGKTASNVKANIDKGNSFVPPTLALQRILNKYIVEETNTTVQ